MVVTRIHLRPSLPTSNESSFLSKCFGERVKTFEFPLPVAEGTKLPEPTLSLMGRRWELLMAEVHEDTSRPSRYGPSQVYQMMYVAVSGDGLETIELRDALERIAAFEDQDSTVRKTIARLLLLRSAGEVFEMRADDFEAIEEPTSDQHEPMLDGCGFIPDAMLLDLVDRMGKAQVRVPPPLSLLRFLRSHSLCRRDVVS